MSTLEMRNTETFAMLPSNIAEELNASKPWWKRGLQRGIARLIFAASLPYEILSLLVAPQRRSKDAVETCAIPRNVQPGNIVFGKTNSIRGKWLQQYLKTVAYTHVGIIMREGSEWYILHASPGSLRCWFKNGGVRKERWDAFVTYSRISNYAFYRIKKGTNKKLLETAEMIARQRLPFDIHYDLNDPTRLYCSEFIWHVGLALGQNWAEARLQKIRFLGLPLLYISPDTIAQSQHLKPIPQRHPC